MFRVELSFTELNAFVRDEHCPSRVGGYLFIIGVLSVQSCVSPILRRAFLVSELNVSRHARIDERLFVGIAQCARLNTPDQC